MAESERWKEISALYADALALPETERVRFLADACGDADVRAEVEALLASHGAAQETLDRPAAEMLAQSLAAETASLTGRRLGAYRIDAPLASGGMGEVYRATDMRLHRAVALKILPANVREDAALRQRFEREAQAIAALRHPHICVLHDIGYADGIDFLVMELLEGETLAARLERGPLPVDAALRYGREIGDALVAIHKLGMVHRDLKPGNVMLTETGAKLLDFGLAKVHDGAAPGTAPSPSSPSLSIGTSTAAGTLPYMTPEQLDRRDVDHRSDIFAFGTLLYEMATGRRAFDGSNPRAVTAAIRENDPDPLPAGVRAAAPGLDAVIARCLRKDPEDRWPDAAAMAEALRRTAAAMPASGTPRPGVRPAYAGAAAAAVLAALVLWNPGGTVVLPDEGGTLRVGATRQLAGADEIEMDPAISPAGDLIAYSAGRGNAFRIVIRSMAGDRVLPAPPNVEAQFHPRWSPDGRRLLYLAREGLFVADLGSGEQVRVAAHSDHKGIYSTFVPGGSQVTAAAWAPAGDEIAVAYGGALMAVAADGRTRRPVAEHAFELHWCDWSSTGIWIACTAGNPHLTLFGPNLGNLAPSAIVLVHAIRGTIVEVTPRTSFNRSPAWSADGRRLYFVSEREGPGDVYAVDVADDGTLSAEATRITTGLGAYSIALSPRAGALAYTRVLARGNIVSLRIPAAGGRADMADAVAVTTGSQVIEAMHVTADNKWLLYDSNFHGHSDIFRVPLHGGTPERLTTEPSDEFGPALSPDGRWLAYYSWRTKTRDVFVQPFEGGAVEQVTASPWHEAFPQWLPDGSIAFSDLASENGILRGVFVTRRGSDGMWTAPERLLPPDTGGPAYARDGRIVYLSPRGIHLQRPGGGAAELLYAWEQGKPRPVRVVVSDDQRSVYFKSHDPEGRASFWSMPMSGGAPRLLVTVDDLARPSRRFDFTAGGGRLFFTLDDRRSNIWIADVTER